MGTSKNGSKLGRLTMALGLGVAVTTGQGVAAADTGDGDGASSSVSSSTSAQSTTDSQTSISPPSEGASDRTPDDNATDSPAVDSGESGTPERATRSGTPELRDATTEIVIRRDDEPVEPTPEPTPEPKPEPTPEPAAETPAPEVVSKSDSDTPREPVPTSAAPTVTATTSSASAERATVEAEGGSTATVAVADAKTAATPAVIAATTAVAPAAPEPVSARSVLGPLTNVLALFGVRPMAPGVPVNPIGQLIELVWVSVRRLEHLLFNNTPVVTGLVVDPQNSAGVITGRVVATDLDPEDQLTYTLSSVPETGRVDLRADGTFTYTPDAAWAHASGGAVTFAVYVSDAASGFHVHLFSAGDTVTAPVKLTVAAVNGAPAFGPIATSAGPTPGSIRYIVPVSDADPGDTVRLVGTIADPTRGTLVQVAPSVFEFTPDAGYAHALSATGATGSVALTFAASDGRDTTTATVTAIVAGTNTAPVLTVGTPVVAANGDVTVRFGVTDLDRDAVTVTLPTPTRGTLVGLTVTRLNGTVETLPAVDVPAGLTMVAGESATLTYRPNRIAGEASSEELTLSGTDGHGGLATASVSVPVPGNNAPSLATTTSVAANGNVMITLTARDPDGDPVTVRLPSPQYGTFVSLTLTGTTYVNPSGTYTMQSGDVATLVFRPTIAASNPPSATLSFVATDRYGGTSTASVNALLPSNRAPSISATTPQWQQNGDVTFTLTLTDADGDDVLMSFPDPVFGQIVRARITTPDGIVSDIAASNGIHLIAPFDSGTVMTLTYRPNRVAGPPAAETLAFTGVDGSGATVITMVSAPIVVPNGSASLVADSPRVVDPARGTASVRFVVTDPEGDAFTVSAGDDSSASVIENADGSYTLTWTPPEGYPHQLSLRGNTAPADFAISVIVVDALGKVSVPTVPVTVYPYNRAPVVAGSIVGSPNADASVAGGVTATDADGDAITYTGTSTGGSVTFGGSGAFVFAPSAAARAAAASVNATAADKLATISIVADDGHGGQVTVTATVDVLPAGAIVFEGARAVDVLRLSDPTKFAVRTSNAVHIIDTAGSGTPRSVSLAGMSVQSLTISPDGAYVYVGTYQSNSQGRAEPIVKIDTRTGAGTTIGQVQQPAAMTVSADGRTLYVAEHQRGTVAAIDTSSGATQHIDVNTQTSAIAVAGNLLYVGGLRNEVRVWDLARNSLTVLPTGPSGTFPPQQAIAAGSAFAYVADAQNKTVAVVNAATNAVARTVTMPSAPTSIVATADGAFAFVASRSAGTVSMISEDSATVLKTLTVGAAPSAVQLSADGSTLYVVTQSRVEVYRVADLYPNRV